MPPQDDDGEHASGDGDDDARPRRNYGPPPFDFWQAYESDLRAFGFTDVVYHTGGRLEQSANEEHYRFAIPTGSFIFKVL